MTDDLIKQVRERHRRDPLATAPGKFYCAECGQPWPCDAIRYAEANEPLTLVARLVLLALNHPSGEFNGGMEVELAGDVAAFVLDPDDRDENSRSYQEKLTEARAALSRTEPTEEEGP